MNNRFWKAGCNLWIQLLMVLYCVAAGYLLTLPATEAKLCTKKVKVTNPNIKKIPMTKRIPAKCSNWDRAWTWITRMDCGTKYVIEYVEFTTHVKEHYKIEYICCPGDEECNKAASHKGGDDISDERFLAIIFGSATAALTIVVVIIIVSICLKQRLAMCKTRSQCGFPQGQGRSEVCHLASSLQNECVCDGHKAIEVEYSEIQEISPRVVSDPSRMMSYNAVDYGLDGSGTGYCNRSNTGDEGLQYTSGDNSYIPLHTSPEPSAPLLQIYAEGGLVFRSYAHSNPDMKSVQCTDDIDYIAISKSDTSPSFKTYEERESELEPIREKIESKEFDEFQIIQPVSHFPSESDKMEKDQIINIGQNNSNEHSGPNLAKVHDKLYDTLKEI